MLEQGYGIAPNVVLYDPDVPDAAFRLFVVISSHCAERGYCWASNEYLGNLVGKHKNSIPRLLKTLEKYITIRDGSNEHRKISLNKNVKAASQKREGGLNKNVKHNNTKENYKDKRGGKPISVENYLATHFTPKNTPIPKWVLDSKGSKRDND